MQAVNNIQVEIEEQSAVEVYRLTDFGATAGLDAAHLIDESGRIVAVFAEPQDRSEFVNWDEAREEDFRNAVRQVIAGFDQADPGEYSLQFDPARDQAEDETVTL